MCTVDKIVTEWRKAMGYRTKVSKGPTVVNVTGTNVIMISK